MSNLAAYPPVEMSPLLSFIPFTHTDRNACLFTLRRAHSFVCNAIYLPLLKRGLTTICVRVSRLLGVIWLHLSRVKRFVHMIFLPDDPV